MKIRKLTESINKIGVCPKCGGIIVGNGNPGNGNTEQDVCSCKKCGYATMLVTYLGDESNENIFKFYFYDDNNGDWMVSDDLVRKCSPKEAAEAIIKNATDYLIPCDSSTLPDAFNFYDETLINNYAQELLAALRGKKLSYVDGAEKYILMFDDYIVEDWSDCYF